MARGVDGRDIFADDRDRSIFMENLTRVVRESGSTLLAYCLMGNHFHLAVKVSDTPLSALIQRLLTNYVAAFNLRHERTGHLFQARYKAIVCLNESYLARLIYYIEMNPVRAGFVAQPHDWPWSSRSGGLGDDDRDFDPWQRSAVVIRGAAENDGPSLATIAMSIEIRGGVAVSDLCGDSSSRKIVDARRLFTHEAVRAGHSYAAIARWLRIVPSSVSRYAREKCNLQGLTPNIR